MSGRKKGPWTSLGQGYVVGAFWRTYHPLERRHTGVRLVIILFFVREFH